jgi:hypothetical protein
MSSGVGGPEWAGVTKYMKRIWQLLLGQAAGTSAAELSHQLGRRTSPRRIDKVFEKNAWSTRTHRISGG